MKLNYKGQSTEEALGLLEDFVRLEKNWDSYGAGVITPESLAAARIILGTVPYVFPAVDGGIVLEYGDTEIIVTIRPDGHVEGWD